MKKFKTFTATAMAFLMTLMVLPISSFETIANAAENRPTFLELSNISLINTAQYKNKSLVSYRTKNNDGKKVLRLSVFEGGKETIIKESFEIGDCYETTVFKGDFKQKIKIVFIKENFDTNENTDTYMEYDFNSKSLGQISEAQYKADGEDFSVITSKEVRKNIVDRVNKKYGFNCDFDQMDESNLFAQKVQTINGKDTIKYSLYIKNDKVNTTYYGIYNDNFEIITDKGLLNKVEDNILWIFERISDNKLETDEFKITTVKDNNVTSERKINLPEITLLDGAIIEGNKLYTQNYPDAVQEYTLENGTYTLSNSFKGQTSVTKDSNNNIWFLAANGDTSTVSKLENGKAVTKYEIMLKIDSANVQFSVYDDTNAIVNSINVTNKTIFVYNDGVTPEVPVIPEVPVAPVVPEAPNNGGTSKPTLPNVDVDKGNITVNQGTNSDAKVVVNALSPNKNNVITPNVASGTKNVEVTLSDIEAIKNGTGAVSIKLANNLDINLPFSLIDKSLLDGAKGVRVKFSTTENSDIVKGIKAVNKVFNFDLLVDKADGTVAIHKFANGVAEVKLTLTDEELKGLDRSKLSIFYYNEETKTFEAMDTVVDGNNITFKTPHFSSYVVGEKGDSVNGITSIGTLPYTGAVVSSKEIVMFSMMLIFAGATILAKKKKETY